MKKNTLIKKILNFCILSSLIILFLYTFNVTTSRYIGQIKATEAVIANPILTLSNNTMSYSIDNMLPGEEKVYNFSVSNVEDGKINEVLLDYTFKIDVGNELPLTVEIYDVTQGETKLELTNGKTKKIRMEYGTEKVNEYKLKIKWDSNKNSYEYTNKKAVCNVTLEAEQVV